MTEYSSFTVCIPAYNEASSVCGVITKLKNDVPGINIVAVNDCSTDDTGAILDGIEGIKVIHNSRNIGYGGSLKAAMRMADTEFVIWYDADGQHRTEDLMRVANKILNERLDCVIGIRGKDSYAQINRRPGKKVLKLVAEIVAGQKVPDLNSGLRVFRKEVIRKYLHLLPNGFSASSTSTIIMMKRGYRLGYSDIKVEKREGSSSVKMFSDGMRTIKLMLNLLVLFSSLRFFGIVGFSFALTGFVYGVIIMLMNEHGFPNFAGVLVITGIMTFFIGLLSEQITEMRKEKFED